jgi:hypothetical protein
LGKKGRYARSEDIDQTGTEKNDSIFTHPFLDKRKRKNGGKTIGIVFS